MREILQAVAALANAKVLLQREGWRIAADECAEAIVALQNVNWAGGAYQQGRKDAFVMITKLNS